ncbi:MAG: GYDIA family GHMP kinase, partial [Flavobacteriaceae bacterium]
MTQEYYSNGKLLLTAEYAVLEGALALAVPTRFGQTLKITERTAPSISWSSLAHDGSVWFQTELAIDTISKQMDADLGSVVGTLFYILGQAQKLNPLFLNDGKGYSVETKLGFPQDWGLGSSSTLISNIAYWANVDPYALLKNTFTGSGYDIACARHHSAIFYQLRPKVAVVKEIAFDPPFKDALFFVHLNKKQNSREGIAAFQKREINTLDLIKNITQITQSIATCTKLADFEALLT